MRTALLSILFLSLAVSPAFAIGGGGHGGGPKHSNTDAKLKTVNDADAAVAVQVSGGFIGGFTLEPKQSLTLYIPTFNNDTVSVTMTASLSGNPAVNVTKTATIKSGKTTNATITSPNSSTLNIAFSGNGQVASLLKRETGVALASSGGLISLLWLGFLLGGKPRRREP